VPTAVTGLSPLRVMIGRHWWQFLQLGVWPQALRSPHEGRQWPPTLPPSFEFIRRDSRVTDRSEVRVVPHRHQAAAAFSVHRRCDLRRHLDVAGAHAGPLLRHRRTADVENLVDAVCCTKPLRTTTAAIAMTMAARHANRNARIGVTHSVVLRLCGPQVTQVGLGVPSDGD
jgi:hypothetical protein